MSNPNEVKVKRYHDYGASTGCVPCADGDWVKYSSYQSLELENKKLREALEKYGRHNNDCVIDVLGKIVHCGCGLEQALEGKE